MANWTLNDEPRSRSHPLPGCPVHHCSRPARSNGPGALCNTHYQQKRRQGRLSMWAEKQGPACGVCGRSVYEHGVTEWCHVETRMAQNA